MFEDSSLLLCCALLTGKLVEVRVSCHGITSQKI